MVDFNRNVHCLLGLPFDAVTLDAAVRQIRNAATGAVSCFLSTPNLNFVTTALHDPAFRASVLQSDLCTVDGMPLVWIARLLGVPIRERVAGSSLFEALRGERPAADAAKDKPPENPVGQPRRLSVFFFGGPPGIAEAAASELENSPGPLKAAGWHDPGFVDVEAMSEQAVIDKINASRADFLVIALGARKGQEWIMRNRERLQVPVLSHLGAVVNFAAGAVHPAPRWMQRAGLEWLWRIKEEPALWRRYARDAWQLQRLFLTRVLPHALQARARRWLPAGKQSATISLSQREDIVQMQLAGDWRQYNLAPLRRCLAHATRTPRAMEIDLAGVRHVDTAFVGLLMLLHGHQQAVGRPLRLAGASRALRRSFRYGCAEFLLTPPPIDPPRPAARDEQPEPWGPKIKVGSEQ